MIAFPCPGCRQSLQVTDELAGQAVRCPRCGRVEAVPAAVAVPAGPPSADATVDRPPASRAPTTPPAAAADPGANGTVPDNTAATVDRPHPPAVGPVAVPGYEVLGELGRGGMGVVYKARQVGLKRLVALKMILAGAHAGESELARFRSEAAAVARLQHPGIVQIHEIGEYEGRPFFSLEFVGGGSLAGRLKGNPQPPREAARLVLALARAVHYAHEHGIIHRDLKPANILLSLSREPGASAEGALAPGSPLNDCTPKIADFGLAKQLDSDAGQTQSGVVMGTPAYMAPEQARGLTREIGPATDVYALGVVLYEMLTGRPPFKAGTALDTMRQLLTDEPVPPSRLIPKLPPDLETICLKCLEKPPGRRYASAAALAEDLESFLEGRVIRARPVGPVGRLRRWCRRNPVVAGLAAAVLVSLVAGTVVAGYFAVHMAREAKRARANEDLANLREVQASTERDRALREEKANRRHAYLTQMNLVADAWERGDVAAAQRLLESLVPRPGQEDVRGPEWHYFRRLCHGFRFAAPGTSAVFLDGGQTVATAGPRHFTVHDAVTGRPRRRIDRKEEDLYLVGRAADGTPLALAWHRGTGTGSGLDLFNPLRPERPPVLSATFAVKQGQPAPSLRRWALAADGRTFAVLLEDHVAGNVGRVRCFDVTTGKERPALHGAPANAYSLALGADGKLLAVGGWGWGSQPGAARHEVRFWETATGRPAAGLPGQAVAAQAVALAPDGKSLAAGLKTWDQSRNRWQPGGIKVWDLPSGKERFAARYEWLALALAFAPDGKALAAGPDSNRGGPVRVWDAAGGERRLDLWGAAGTVTDLAFAPDGKALAAASEDGQVRVWDARATRPAGLATRSWLWAEQLRAVAFAPDGRTLATAGLDRTVRLWDPATGRPRGVLYGHRAAVTALAFSPDGRTLASGSDDQTVRLWDPAAGRLRETRREGAAVLALAFQPGGALLAVGTTAEVRLYDAGSGKEAAALREGRQQGRTLAFTPDGRTLAAAGSGAVRAWDPADGRLRPGFPTAHPQVTSLAFAPDGGALVSAAADGTFRCWETATGKAQPAPPAVRGFAVACLTAAPAGNYLAFTIDYNSSLVLHCHRWQPPWPEFYGVKDFPAPGRCLAIAPDGRRVAVGMRDGTVALFAPAGQRLERLLPGHAAGVGALAFSPDGATLAEGRDDFTIRLRDRRTGRERLLTGHEGQVTSVAFSADGALLASGSRDRTVRLWETATGRLRATYQTPRKWPIRVVAVSPDGRRVAGGEGSLDIAHNEVAVWDRAGRARPLIVKPGGWEVWGLAISPDGRRLTVGTGSFWGNLLGNITVWDLATGRRLRGLGDIHTEGAQARRSLSERTWGFRSVAVSRDGRRLAAGCWDGRVRLWDLAGSGEPVELKGHAYRVCQVAFDGAGTTLISADEGGLHLIWDLRDLSRPVRVHAEAPTALALAPDGRAWALADRRRGRVQVLEAAPAELAAAFDGAAGRGDAARAAPESRLARFRLKLAALRARAGDAAGAWAAVESAHMGPGRSTDGRPLGEALLALGDAFADRGLTAETVRAYRRAAAVWPGQGQAHYRLAGELANLGKGAEAAAACRAALARGLEDGQGHFLLGRLLLQAGNLAGARTSFRAAVRRQPALAEDVTRQGRDLADRGKWEEARAVWQDVIDLRPDLGDPHLALGSYFYEHKRYPEAAREYREATRLSPDLLEAHYAQAAVALKLGNPDEAVAAGRELLRRDPTDARAQRLVGWTLIRRGRAGEALPYVRAAIRLRPRDVRNHHDLARALLCLGRRAEAEAAARQAVRLQPDDCRNYWGAAWALRGPGDQSACLALYQEAVRLTERQLAARHDQPELRCDLGLGLNNCMNTLGEMGRDGEAEAAHKRAAALLERLVTDHPDRPRYRQSLAVAYNDRAWLLAAAPDPRKRDPRRAVALARQAVALEPSAERFWNTLGLALCRAGDGQAALEAMNRALALHHGGDPNDWLILALIHARRGDRAAARKWYDKALLGLKKFDGHDCYLQAFQAEARALVEGAEPTGNK